MQEAAKAVRAKKKGDALHKCRDITLNGGCYSSAAALDSFTNAAILSTWISATARPVS